MMFTNSALIRFVLGLMSIVILLSTAYMVIGAADDGPTQSPAKATSRYAPQGFADRIVLTPGADAAREMAISFRTDTNQSIAEAQIAPAFDGPKLQSHAVLVMGKSSPIDTESGKAFYHQVRFKELMPGTTYAYRVKGAAGWSEWLQFRTAADEFRPFRFLYFGDIQNGILPIASRVIRQAFSATASPALALYAGDLVNQRNRMPHDDEWGELFEAASYNFSIVPQIPAAGNHEYEYAYVWDEFIDLPSFVTSRKKFQSISEYSGLRVRELSDQWKLGFALPGNGAKKLRATSYYVDYQGVRFLILDATAALDFDLASDQTEWMKSVLSEGSPKWTVVLLHQPLLPCRYFDEGVATLQEHWAQTLEEHNVDLVLQGHDHCYGRYNTPLHAAHAPVTASSQPASGPVYVVSVAGAKMYANSEEARQLSQRIAEDTQLYQVVDVDDDRLLFRAFTVSGRLYDAFDLVRDSDGSKRVVEPDLSLIPIRACRDTLGPDGVPCTAK